jgi:hypothetical protein
MAGSSFYEAVAALIVVDRRQPAGYGQTPPRRYLFVTGKATATPRRPSAEFQRAGYGEASLRRTPIRIYVLASLGTTTLTFTRRLR